MSDHSPDNFIDQAPVVEIRVSGVHLVVMLAEKRLRAQLVETQESRAEAIVHIVIVVCDGVGDIDELQNSASEFPPVFQK
jgi:hypothetical protein